MPMHARDPASVGECHRSSAPVLDFPLSTADVDEEDGIGPLMLTARANVLDNSCLLLAPSSSDGRVDDEKPGTLFLAPY